jgi:periplasmic divalent cation tolerance protein
MEPTQPFEVALVTAPDLETARKLAQAVLQAHLAACVNLLPGLESHYWWQGKLENATEGLMLLKTTPAKREALQQLIISQHPYDTPEFLVLPIAAGSEKYLAWLSGSLAP